MHRQVDKTDRLDATNAIFMKGKTVMRRSLRYRRIDTINMVACKLTLSLRFEWQ